MNKSLIGRIFSTAGMIALAGAMALAQDAPSNTQRSDGQIEMDVVHALDASQALKNDLITAATIQSEVTLSGTVSSDSSKQLAESIAKTVPGVTKVHNNLKVGNPAEDANAQGAPTNDPSNDMADAQAAPPPKVRKTTGRIPIIPTTARMLALARVRRRASTRLLRQTGATRTSSSPGSSGLHMDSSSLPTGSSSRDTDRIHRLRGTDSSASASGLWTGPSSGIWAAARLCAGSASAAVSDAARAGHRSAGNSDPGAD